MTQSYKSWPFKEAEALRKRIKERPESEVTFETGFGPSGLPHIGHFAEVARTNWVRQAFEFTTDWPTKLIVFSDDMDGLRRVPPNMPQQDMLTENLGKPLSHVPDPFGCCGSYSAHMNNKLEEFFEPYGFDYEFRSSYEAYRRGDFDKGLTILLEKAEEVLNIILPTLGEDKREAWSHFFPICKGCGRIYSTRVIDYHPEGNTIDYVCDQTVGSAPGCGHEGTTSVLGGRVKVGWKVDWALRWYSYDIAYEMYGKDLIESAKLSSKIVRLMGKHPPAGFFYEMFLDEEGGKISSRVGKGITVDSWVTYAPLESLLHYLFQNPKRAKRLFWDVVPKSVDDYLAELRRYPSVEIQKQPDLAIWHIFDKGEEVPNYNSTINFSLINNLVSGLGTEDVDLITEYLERYDPEVKAYRGAVSDLVEKSSKYYQDFVLPNKHFRDPTEVERRILDSLCQRVVSYQGDDEGELQALPFEVAESFDVPPSEVFQAFYQVLLGQERGPRFGTFAVLVGKDKVKALLETAIS